jgi:glycosyltransferase involved in cell wall biosynthesis
MNLFISVIIPTFNSSSTIMSCINSIIEQSFFNFEILIIDGLSKDNTIELVNSYHDNRIRVFSEKDEGTYDAMNKGISLSKGKWLYFIGSDDSLYDNEVFNNVNKYILTDNSKKIIYGNVLVTGDTGWAKNNQIYDGYYNIKKLLSTNICHQAIFYERSIFEQQGCYNTLYNVCADFDLNLRMAAKFELHYLDLVVAKFNAGGASTESMDIYFNQDFNTNILKYYENQLMASYMGNFSKAMIGHGTKKVMNYNLKGFSYLFAGSYHLIRAALNRIFKARIQHVKH